ncbi:hypothetical protein GGR55DRAFT_685506 [Xylaria sp. FL0064]|nr:hypothetical protein GGR55DRAFT_685506 [Xylaria sp. FL0064]
MLGLGKATVLLAPLLKLVSAAAVPTGVSPGSHVIVPSSSLLTLELDEYSNSSPLQHTALELRIFESGTPCGPGNVTLNGELLDRDSSGRGSGSFTTESGNVLGANWEYTCVQESQAQLLNVRINSVDGQNVDDIIAFAVRFQQTAPVTVAYVFGATLKSELLLDESDQSSNPQPSLEDELAELEVLKEQLLAVEHSIALKVAHITDTFDLGRPEKVLLSDCSSLKCFFGTIYDRVKTMASKVYHGGQGKTSHLASQLGSPTWPSSHGGQRPLEEFDEEEQRPNSASLPQAPARVSSQNKVEGLISVADKGNGQPQRPLVDDPHQIRHILFVVAVVMAIAINLTIMALMFQCVRLLRQRRKAQWEKRRRQLRESRAACNALVATKYMDLIQWLRDGLRRESIEDEEKDAIMRRIQESHSDEESSDTLSISMEEEIAQFRAAAGFVGNLVSGEGRGRDRVSNLILTRPRRASTPSSMSSCPTYRSVDESLPAYDENRSPEYVVDGIQYTPSSSTHGNSSPRSSTSEDSTTCSSLDEDVERKD